MVESRVKSDSSCFEIEERILKEIRREEVERRNWSSLLILGATTEKQEVFWTLTGPTSVVRHLAELRRDVIVYKDKLDAASGSSAPAKEASFRSDYEYVCERYADVLNIAVRMNDVHVGIIPALTRYEAGDVIRDID